MAYRLELTEQSVPDALREVAAEQLADAARNLREVRVVRPGDRRPRGAQGPQEDPVDPAPGPRGDERRARGRRPTPRCATSRRSSRRVRDADVMVETARQAARPPAGAGRSPSVARALRRAGRGVAREGRRRRLRRGRRRADGAARRRAALARRGRTSATSSPPSRVAYARGREELHACRDDRFYAGGLADVELLHEWRKRVKDLWYHAKLLEEAWPPVLQALGDEAHALADHLGDDHDLGVLAERIERRSGRRPSTRRASTPLIDAPPRASCRRTPSRSARSSTPRSRRPSRAASRRLPSRLSARWRGRRRGARP